MTNSLPNPIVYLNKRTMVYANEITLLEADINYTKVYFEEKAPLMVAVTLKKIQPLLEIHGFLRIHKKFLINLNYADKSLLKNEIVTLPGNVLIKVSRRKRSTLRRNLKKKK
ncbi:LytTR family DNA-binding domain-containing protein [Emticicia sp. BO119]|uniref:LytR/AlgR family response regulator transcription factor n=1 Tax=Emticicia sp. BO119 TaxID=2757768 RepID=UPI0015F00D14|nr:LytTR family DNA-binding domain-containing protein [Emticicia sp. BO119]MBA4849280.1 LytTR family transcriptional regulator [Emticicia sp. BO119]